MTNQSQASLQKCVPQKCVLCGSENLERIFALKPLRDYFWCQLCDLRFLNPALRLTPEDEESRYLKHQNDIHDPGYQNFVRPLYSEIKARVPAGARGLDYGSGSSSVLATLLKNDGYDISLYDPVFFPEVTWADGEFDFLFACEVAEHFFSPMEQFDRIKSTVRKNGFIAFMTLMYNSNIDFDSWHYRRDPTHVTFYSEKSFRWIAQHFNFSGLTFKGDRVVCFYT